MMFLGLISNAIDAIQGLIGTLLYTVFAWAGVLLINLFQSLFRGFAGVGNIRYGTENITYSPDNPLGEKTGGIVYYLMNSEVVRNLIISMAILGLFLLIIFTAMAFIKNVYSDKPKNWKDIVASSLKGLMNFVFIPTLCLLGVALSNILLNAIDSATNPSGTTQMANKLIVCCSYNANRIRAEKELNNEIVYAVKFSGSVSELENLTRNNATEREKYAKLLDEYVGTITPEGLMSAWSMNKFYNVWDINYILLVVGAVFIMSALIKLTYGMIKRMFILLMLFVISPALCSLYPLDDGNAVKSWSKDFVKNTISAYGVIAGMNLFFSLSPLLERINFGWWDPIGLIPLILMISGLYVVNDFVTMISGYISAGNAMADGASLRGNVKKYVNAKNVAKGIVETGRFVGNAGKLVVGGVGSLTKDETKKAKRVDAAFDGLTGIGRQINRGALGAYNAISKSVGGSGVKAEDIAHEGSFVKAAWNSSFIGSDINKIKKDTEKFNKVTKDRKDIETMKAPAYFNDASMTAEDKAYQINKDSEKVKGFYGDDKTAYDKKMKDMYGKNYKSYLEIYSNMDYGQRQASYNRLGELKNSYNERQEQYDSYKKVLSSANNVENAVFNVNNAKQAREGAEQRRVNAATNLNTYRGKLNGLRNSVNNMLPEELANTKGLISDEKLLKAKSVKIDSSMTDQQKASATAFNDFLKQFKDAAKELAQAKEQISKTKETEDIAKTALNDAINSLKTTIQENSEKLDESIKNKVKEGKDKDIKELVDAIKDISKNFEKDKDWLK